MRRLFWILVGAGIAVAVVFKGRELYRRITPRGIAEQVEQQGHRAASGFGDFVATFRVAMADREAELRRELNITTTTND